MRSHRLVIFLVGFIGLTMCSVSLFQGVRPASADELVYGNFLPPKHNSNKYGLVPLFKELEEASGGKFKWDLVAGGQLFGDKAALESVGAGIADASMILPAYVQAQLKHDYIFADMLMFGDDALAMNGAFLETFFFECTECQEDYKRNNTIMVAGYTSTNAVLACNSVIHNLQEFEGKKTRTGGAQGAWVKAMGGVPVSMTPGDMVTALSRGQVACNMGPFGWLQSLPGYIDSIESIIDFPMGNYSGHGFITLNLDTWKALPTAHKALLLKHSPAAIARVMIAYEEQGEEGKRLARKNGIVLTDGGKQLADLIKTYRDDEVKRVAEAAKRRGVDNPMQIVSAQLSNIAKWKKLLADPGTRTVDGYAALLWDQIYSKLDPEKM